MQRDALLQTLKFLDNFEKNFPNKKLVISPHPNEKFEPAEYYIGYILQSWHNRSIKPKFHVSEQGSGRCGHHSDYIETIPDYLLNIPELYATDIDIMIEAKMKEQAIFKLYQKYPHLNCKIKRPKLSIKAMEWAKNCLEDRQCCE